jgi:hypothetical protein
MPIPEEFSEPQMGGFGKCPQIGAVHNKDIQILDYDLDIIDPLPP